MSNGSFIQTCSFCQRPVYPGHGVTFVRNDGTVFRFCTSKCNKAFKMKRNPRRVKHTQLYREQQGKTLQNDPAFMIEKRRNRPVRYSRELWQKTQVAMDKLQEIRFKRAQRLRLERMRAHAIRVLSSKKARELGFSVDQNVPLPEYTKHDQITCSKDRVTQIRASVVHKLNLKYAQRVAQKMKEVQ